MRTPACLCIPPTVAKHRFDKHVPAATNTQALIEELADAVFAMWSVSHQILNM
jgi:hypothetical protein